jgi:uncharacterized caspase-like protein
LAKAGGDQQRCRDGISGHGVQGADKRYRFTPYDFDPDHLERTTVTDTDGLDFIGKVGGKTVVFLDTCYSGDVMSGAKAVPGDVDGFVNDLKNAGPGVVVFTASSGKEFAGEDPKWGHGAFTLALLEAMQGQGGFTKRGVVWVSDIEGYVYKRVKELTKGGQKPLVAKPRRGGSGGCALEGRLLVHRPVRGAFDGRIGDRGATPGNQTIRGST